MAFYGNTANNFTEVTAALREYSDIDAFLLLDEKTDIYTDPRSYVGVETNSNSEPSWIFRGKWLNSLLFSRSPIIRWCKEHAIDVLVCSDMGARVLPYIKCTTIFAPIGFDLILFPVKPLSREYFILLKSSFLSIFHQSPRKILYSFAWLRLRTAQYRGIRAADFHLVIEHPPFVEACARFQLSGQGKGCVSIGRSWIPVDTRFFAPRPLFAVSSTARMLRMDSEFIIFHPTRLHMVVSASERRTGPWKGNDTLLLGVRDFLEGLPQERRSKVRLLLPDRPATHSRDVQAARSMIHDLGIESNVIWLPPPSDPSGFTRGEIVDLYSICDVVADHFAQPGLGSASLEALSVGKPLLLSFHPDVEERNYGEPLPALAAATPSEVASHLDSMYRDDSDRQALGAAARVWAEKFHSRKAASEYWTAVLRDVVFCRV